MKLYGAMSDWAFDNIGEEEEGEGTWCKIFLDKESAMEHITEHMSSEYECIDDHAFFHILEFDLKSNEKWAMRVTLTPVSKV